LADSDRVLELLRRGGSRYRTLRATIVTRRDWPRVVEAHRRSVEEAERRGMKTLTVSLGRSTERESTERTRIWFEPPDRIRAETEGKQPETVVMDGKHAFRTSRLDGDIVRGPLRSPYDMVQPLFLLRPRVLLPSYSLEPVGDIEIAGRPATAVVARIRPAEGTRLEHVHRFSWGADEHRLALDREYGILLRAAAVMEGEEFDVTEMTEVAFDEPIEPEVFRREPPSGAETITAEDEFRRLRENHPHPRDRKRGLERMARQADFVLFAPGPDGRPVTGSSSGFHEDCVAATFTQLWGDESHDVQVVLRSYPGPEMTFLTVSRTAEGYPAVLTIRDGTSIEVSSATLGNERLLEVVSTLEPVVPAED
jgi:outer membrane lipoprotein-sorting protein